MVKSKFTKCNLCPLVNQKLIIGETNCGNNLQKVKLLVLAEVPATEEIEQNRPLVGRSGKKFRKPFEEMGLSKLPYYITNVVLCTNLIINEQTGRINTKNPPKEAIELCQQNWINLINVIQPEYILLMGGVAKDIFGINGSIKNIRGKFYNYTKNPNLLVTPRILVTYHPSYFTRPTTDPEDYKKFQADLQLLYNTISTTHNISLDINNNPSQILKPYYFNMLDWMKSDDVCLMDIQNIRPKNEIVYIFKTKENKIKYHYVSTNNNYYYKRNEAPGNAPVLSKINEVELCCGRSPKESYNTIYEGDLRLEVKHSIDYYLQRTKPECNINPKIMYFDIEIYNEGSKSFPFSKYAKKPINAISFKIDDGSLNMYLVPFNKDQESKILNYSSNIDSSTNITIFKTETELLLSFAQVMRISGVNIITGWNCIAENEYIWMDKYITSIKNYKILDNVSKYGKIINGKFTGYQKGYNIKLKYGFKIISSKNHIFPIYSKKPNQYKYPNSLLKTREELSIEEIIKKSNEYDIYFKIEKNKNNNDDYTFKNYLIDNIETILEFKEFDLIFTDPKILNKLKNISITHPNIFSNCFKGFAKCKFNNIWTYKRFKKWISFDELKKQLMDHDNQIFIIGKNRKVFIDINKKIDFDVLQLLGLQYTDGFWSKYSSGCHSICNKDKLLMVHYTKIMNFFRKRNKIINIDKFFKHKVYTIDFGICNEYTLLMPLIYNKNRKKSLNLESLSKLSKKQFYKFFSGVIDGDGCISPDGYITLCNFEDNGNDLVKLQQLLLWNGIVSTNLNDNKGGTMFIPFFDHNRELYKNLTLYQSLRKKRLNISKNNLKKYKNTPSKLLNKFIFDDYILLKLNKIEELSIDYPMYDIETEKHYFICNGIKSHNCSRFDIPYIYNRMKKLRLDVNLLSPLGITYINKYKSNEIYIYGIYNADMLELYKKYTENKEESYKLDFVANKQLKKGKVEYEGTLDELYEKDIEKFIKYSSRDTELIYELDKKLGHIKLRNELRRICHSTWKASESTMGLIDPLCISYAKKQGYVCKNADISGGKYTFQGAYVHQPISGLHSWLIDLDFTAMYPNIIISYNIGPETYIGRISDELAQMYIYNKNNLPDKIEIVLDPMKSSNKSIMMSNQEFHKWISDNEAMVNISGSIYIGHDKQKSYFAEFLQSLLDSRKEYKKEMNKLKIANDSKWKYFYNIQWAYKILANSIYGVFGNFCFRFSRIDLARSVTLAGQEMTKFSGYHISKYMKTKDYNIDMNYLDFDFKNEELKYWCYGDTDSFFIQLGDWLMDEGKL